MSDTTTEAPANGVPKYRKITLAESFKLGVWCEANRTRLEPLAHAELAKEFSTQLGWTVTPPTAGNFRNEVLAWPPRKTAPDPNQPDLPALKQVIREMLADKGLRSLVSPDTLKAAGIEFNADQPEPTFP